VAVADEVERLLAVELLVTGLEIDRREATRPALRVEVAPVDVHVDAVQLVHEEIEAVELTVIKYVDGEFPVSFSTVSSVPRGPQIVHAELMRSVVVGRRRVAVIVRRVARERKATRAFLAVGRPASASRCPTATPDASNPCVPARAS